MQCWKRGVVSMENNNAKVLTPLMQLRWVEKEMPVDSTRAKIERVLQQKCVDAYTGETEWIDVPLMTQTT